MPRIVDHAQRRREIVTAVWAVIATGGIEAVSLRTVAAEANVSVGRIQHYFATKDELLRHGCEMMLTDARAHFDARIAGLSAFEALHVLVLRAVPTTPGFAVGTMVWSAYVLKSRDDPVIADLVCGAHDDGVRIAAQFIRSARRTGEFADCADADALALRLLATAEGYAARVLAGSLPAARAIAALECELDRIRAG